MPPRRKATLTDHRPAAILVRLRRQLIKASRRSTASPINELNPTAGRARRSSRSRPTRAAPARPVPDVIDIGLAFGPEAKSEGLIRRTRSSTWADIPATRQGRRRLLVRRLLRRLAFEVNTTVVKDVPADWNDLLKPEYKGQVALAGDPTELQPGHLRRLGVRHRQRRLPRQRAAGPRLLQEAERRRQLRAGHGARRPTLPPGETPIRIAWTYNALADKDTLEGNPPITVVVPKTGRFGGMYVQAISALRDAPERGQAVDGVPLFGRRPDQVAEGLLQPDPLRRDGQGGDDRRGRCRRPCCPDTAGTVLPTFDQINKATDVITKGWTTTVGVTVK